MPRPGVAGRPAQPEWLGLVELARARPGNLICDSDSDSASPIRTSLCALGLSRSPVRVVAGRPSEVVRLGESEFSICRCWLRSK